MPNFTPLLIEHGVIEEHLTIVYDRLVLYLDEFCNIRIEKVSQEVLNHLGERMYRINRKLNVFVAKPPITCAADPNGILYIHENMEQIGGICGRLFDVLHIGGGHMTQLLDEDTLNFFVSIQIGDGPEKAADVEKLEELAAKNSLALLRNLLNEIETIDLNSKERIFNLFSDLTKKDTQYILDLIINGGGKIFLS